MVGNGEDGGMMFFILFDFIEFGFDFVWFVWIDVYLRVKYIDGGCFLYVVLLIGCGDKIVYLLMMGDVWFGEFFKLDVIFCIVLMIKFVILIVFMQLVEQG